MMRATGKRQAGWCGGVLLAVVGAGLVPAAEPGKPLEVLYVTGGCCHDYEAQKKIIAEGLAARARVNVTVVHEGGESREHRVSIYGKPRWAEGYDVVFHNECFGHVNDPEFLGKIIAEHARGVPGVFMHCSMHSYRMTPGDEWRQLIGITSPAHGKHYPYTVKLVADHPILTGLPREWEMPQEELYYSDRVWPSATPLGEAFSREREAMQTVIWTNDYRGTRVFGTTIGHYNHTVEMPEFLDLLTRGTLWAAGRLRDDGTPAPEVALAAGEAAAATGWAASVRLPAEERSRAVRLFNGRDFTGWEGHVDTWWSIEDGEIVGRNTAENAPQVSTYLLTKKPYRNVRLLLEGKLVTSEMHSGVALWGQRFESGGENASYQGHLVMFPSGWGLYDLFRRKGICRDQDGRAKAAGRQHDWNRMEILAIGDRIRLAVNGREVLDWTDPQPELCQAGPIGLQLHSNKVAQEVRFRGLVLVEDPQDVLVTAEPEPAAAKPAEPVAAGSR
jgi:type 1 glutamine amidotransferase